MNGGIADKDLLMDSYPFMVAEGTLLFLAVVLVIEYAFRRREVSRQLVQNRQKQHQLATFSAELKNLNKKLARKSEIADQFPRITKKLTEKFPSDAYPAIAVRSAKEFFQAGKAGYFAPVEGSSDFTLVIGVGFPPDWAGTVRIHCDEGILVAKSVGLDGGIAKGTDADQETPTSADISTDSGDTGSDPVEFTLGKPGENLNP